MCISYVYLINWQLSVCAGTIIIPAILLLEFTQAFQTIGIGPKSGIF